MNKKCQKQAVSIAFTLVELLVVISIIGLLAGLAVPAINSGLKSAKAGACLSNLHQIGVATIAYAADNSLKLPDAGSGTTDMWAAKIATFMGGDTKKKNNVFVCPGSLKSVSEATGANVAITYGVHGGVMPKGGTASNITCVLRQSEVILAADMCQDPGNKGWSPFCLENPSIVVSQSGGRSGSMDLSAAIATSTDADTGNNAWMRYRHSGKVNVVMFDGHAEAIEKGKVLNKHVVFGQ
jgi:prepilin-type processing-associated H-X9-DG protein/prepilin-type N-terminal cleavage/methylation domain-containing protein